MSQTTPTLPLRIRSGSVMGMEHRKLGVNNQDGRCLHQFSIGEKNFMFSAVFDGCSTKDPKNSKNEVGSQLLNVFIPSEVRMLLLAGTPIEKIPEYLYPRVIGYLSNIARSSCSGDLQEQWQFISTRLLATILAAVTDGTTLVIFWAGDGIIVADENVKILDQQDHPTYVAYHLLDRQTLGEHADKLPSSFETVVLSLSEVTRFAISTDGLKTRNPDTGEYWVNPIHLAGLWEYQPSAGAGLQWFLNKEQLKGSFSDDVTVIAVTVEALKGEIQ